jgi:thiosulfate dehydrogenase
VRQPRRAGRVLLFLLGLLTGALAIIAAAYFYVASGRAPVSALDSNLPIEKLVIDRPLRRQLAASRMLQAPVAASEANLQAGARIYEQQCAVCHGMPTGPISRIASGMYPPPPQLFHGEGVSSRPIGETYWKISHGIRLTGMPAFRNTLSENQIWEISVLLANAQKLPPSVTRVLHWAGDTPLPGGHQR